MAIANCSRCNRMFQKTMGMRICPDCVQAEEDAFRRVRDYLELNPGKDIASVAAATEVEEAFVLKLLQSGRLATLGELAEGLGQPCRQCGKPQIQGKYCPDCVDLLGHALKTHADILGSEKGDPATMRLRRPETMQEKRRGT
jgi:hypothetical protein